MSLYNFVYNLQRKNNKTKKRILIGLLVASFIVLMFFWVLMFKNQLQKIDLSQKSGATKLLGDEEKIVSPLAALIQGFKSLKGSASKKINEYGNTVSNNKDMESQKVRTVYELPVE